jgi:hypothetical protein
VHLKLKLYTVIGSVDVGRADSDFLKKINLLKPALNVVHRIECVCVSGNLHAFFSDYQSGQLNIRLFWYELTDII